MKLSHLLRRQLHSSTRGAGLVEYGILVGLIAVASIAAVSTLGRQVNGTFTTVSDSMGSVVAQSAPVVAPPEAQSCQDLYAQGERSDGVYRFGAGAGAVNTACHFEDTGPLQGGWTVVALQYETNPLANWAAGIDPDRAATTYFDTSFVLAPDQIPASGSFGVGRLIGGNFEMLEAVTRTYGTGNLDIPGAPGLVNTSMTYDIHRETDAFYPFHDPEDVKNTDPGWNNTLTFDARTGVNNGFTWAFSPNPQQEQRGYSYDGVRQEFTFEDYGWAVFVR